MSASKAKGTKWESAIVAHLRANGFPHADRQPLRGNRDAGDLALTAGVVAEIKAVSKGGTGQPPAQLLGSWMAQAEAERFVRGHDTPDIGRMVNDRRAYIRPRFARMHVHAVGEVQGVLRGESHGGWSPDSGAVPCAEDLDREFNRRRVHFGPNPNRAINIIAEKINGFVVKHPLHR